MLPIKKERPVRRYSGIKWTSNITNKKYLKEDFNNRCGYCDDLDIFNGGSRTYHVEHFAPKEKFPDLEFEYSNLLYACPYCNGFKSDKWPSNDSKINVVENKGFLDPCKDEYYHHLHRNNDGSIGYDSELGEYIYRELHLGLLRHQIIYKLSELYSGFELLDEKIKNKKMAGDNTADLEEILSKVAVNFVRSFKEL